MRVRNGHREWGSTDARIGPSGRLCDAGQMRQDGAHACTCKTHALDPHTLSLSLHPHLADSRREAGPPRPKPTLPNRDGPAPPPPPPPPSRSTWAVLPLPARPAMKVGVLVRRGCGVPNRPLPAYCVAGAGRVTRNELKTRWAGAEGGTGSSTLRASVQMRVRWQAMMRVLLPPRC